jgi:tRNA threonylcarbamoyladenosine biosynthesis protein TsaB
MRVLGIDTATTVASAAVIEGGRLIAEGWPKADSNREPQSNHGNHAQTLVPLIERVLRQAGLSPGELAAIAVSIGPGSFTGLRIGLSTVQGLALGSALPVVGIPTLLAIAARVVEWEGLICAVLDARKKEVYSGLFWRHLHALEQIAEDAVESPELTIEKIQAHRGSRRCLLIGDGLVAYGAMMKQLLGDGLALSLQRHYPSIATSVARLAADKVPSSGPYSNAPLLPRYLRPSEAEFHRNQDAAGKG